MFQKRVTGNPIGFSVLGIFVISKGTLLTVGLSAVRAGEALLVMLETTFAVRTVTSQTGLLVKHF
jgi:hypothetical protein